VISRSPSTESSIVDLEEVQHKKKLEFAVQSRGKGTRKWINRVRAERSTRTSLPRSRSPLRPPAPGLVPHLLHRCCLHPHWYQYYHCLYYSMRSSTLPMVA
jgi:hypothetical protein